MTRTKRTMSPPITGTGLIMSAAVEVTVEVAVEVAGEVAHCYWYYLTST